MNQGIKKYCMVSYYLLTDYNLVACKYVYRLKLVDFNGSFEYSDLVNVEIINPLNFKLFQNYPNPFNPSTTINFQIQEAGLVTLIVYDILGNEITTLVNEKMEPGNNRGGALYNHQYLLKIVLRFFFIPQSYMKLF
jgi:hypothetical protein